MNAPVAICNEDISRGKAIAGSRMVFLSISYSLSIFINLSDDFLFGQEVVKASCQSGNSYLFFLVAKYFVIVGAFHLAISRKMMIMNIRMISN